MALKDATFLKDSLCIHTHLMDVYFYLFWLLLTGQDLKGYVPKWFQQEEDVQTGGVIHAFTGEYWQCKEKHDWSRCPDIYLEQHWHL